MHYPNEPFNTLNDSTHQGLGPEIMNDKAWLIFIDYFFQNEDSIGLLVSNATKKILQVFLPQIELLRLRGSSLAIERPHLILYCGYFTKIFVISPYFWFVSKKNS